MGNNDEIRRRMERYRHILLALVWIVSVICIVAGFIMIATNGIAGVVIIVVGVLNGIVGHFLINVLLSIPFILLNNGDILKINGDILKIIQIQNATGNQLLKMINQKIVP